jgi:hypothetical protein
MYILIRTECPIGHGGDGVRRVREEEHGDVEQCVSCASCPATYVRVHGRWFEASSSETLSPESGCGD